MNNKARSKGGRQMKILHLNAGNETGGGMYHILSLLKAYNRQEFILGVMEKGELYKRAMDLGIQTVYFPNHIRMSLPLMYRIAHYLRQENITCIHTHGPRANVYASFLKRFASFYWVLTVHSDPFYDFLEKGAWGKILTRMNLNAIKKADHIIAISDPFKQTLMKYGVRNQQITTVFNGVDFRQKKLAAHAKRDFGIADEYFLFLKVARLERVKGHQFALEAFSRLIKKKANCQMMFLGDGSLLSELKAQAKALNIKEYVHFLGHREDVSQFYGMADATLLTSLSESFPLVLLESARARTPIISSNVGGVNKLITDHSLGWIIEPGNVNELVHSMEEVLGYHEKGQLPLIGDKLYRHASSKFSIDTFANAIYDVYLRMEDIN